MEETDGYSDPTDANQTYQYKPQPIHWDYPCKCVRCPQCGGLQPTYVPYVQPYYPINPYPNPIWGEGYITWASYKP